jgi:hypothetical protein
MEGQKREVLQDEAVKKLVSPRIMMRERRPELFSDTETEFAPLMTEAIFGYHLETLTSRKQEYEFENFCRHLAQKEICPNLRPQTGPTGGGDSKVDSETYAVADEIAARWWWAEANAGSERWGFAFSAKKVWRAKARADVANVMSTGRNYTKIFFITSQFARDKDRAALEDELSKKCGLPVTIHDRTWIVEKVFRNDHIALAMSTLGISGVAEEKRQKPGPIDFARQAELEELDKQIADPARYQGAKFQLAEDCLRTVIVARGLERPRSEVDGRFCQAQRIAQEVGLNQQMARIAYHWAWTCHWWYEDFPEFAHHYRDVEILLAETIDAEALADLMTLWNLLAVAEHRGDLAADVARSEARRETLTAALSRVAADGSRPNNALHAQALQVLVNLFHTTRTGQFDQTDDIWIDMKKVVDASDGMGQFPLEKLFHIVQEIGRHVDSDAFDSLYETMTEKMRERKSDGEAGESYHDRGVQKLDQDKPYDAIRWFGRAESLLGKEEYVHELMATLVGATFAFGRTGLHWAARSRLLIVLGTGFEHWTREGRARGYVLAALRQLLRVETLLGRVPHILQALSLIDTAVSQMQLLGDRLEEVRDEFTMADCALGILFLRTPFNKLETLEKLPDILLRMGLPTARLCVLYALGQDRIITTSEVLAGKSSAERDEFFVRLADQPAAAHIPTTALLLNESKVDLKTVILGSEIVISTPCDTTSLGLAESVLGALEAFLSTCDESDVVPHAERTMIALKISAEATGLPTIEFSGKGGFAAEIVRPQAIEFKSAGDHGDFSDWLSKTVVQITAHRFMVRYPENWLKKHAGEERAFARAVMHGNMLIASRNVFGESPPSRIADWSEADDKMYDRLREQPWRDPAIRPRAEMPPLTPGTGRAPANLFDNSNRKHTERSVLSPVDNVLWADAGWQAAAFETSSAFAHFGLWFKNRKPALEIFNQWRQRWGLADKDNALRIAIITGVSAKDPAHYTILIGPNVQAAKFESGETFVTVSKVLVVAPTTDANLSAFLNAFGRLNTFLLAPAFGDGSPTLEMSVALVKFHLDVRPAWQIGENDPDIVAVHDDDEPIIPAGMDDAPILKALQARKDRKKR